MKRPALVNLATCPREWVSVPELARYLDCSPRTIRRMIESGTLYAYRVGLRWQRIPIEEARRAFPEPPAKSA